VRRLIACLLLVGCAQTGMPPGGPPDREPPRLVRVTPDTNALNVRGGSVAFDFDEVVSERPQGVPTLADLFIISPSTGRPGISWRRTRVELSPRGGLRPNTTYTVRMLPGLMDLDSNVDSSGTVLVFSTGPTLATGRISGRAFDWAAGRPTRATIEAVSLPDSAIYGTEADSVGAFAIEHMPPGTYLLRAHVDQNRNRLVDPRELIDTITIALTDSLRREMLAAVRDSLGPGIANLEARDSVTLRISFDRPLDTLFVPQPAMFSVRSSDSADVPVAAVRTQSDVDREAADSARLKAIQDSVRAAVTADSIRVADSTRAAAAAAAPPARPTGRRPGASNRPPPAPPADTSERIIPRPSARAPATVLFLTLGTPLAPNTSYRVRTDSLTSITGARRSSQRVVTTPRPRERPDTGAVRPDTGGGRPGD
jgi:hypothetical protein